MDDPVVLPACATCAAPAPDGAAFCPQCGTRLGGSASPSERHVFGLAPPRLLLAVTFVVRQLGRIVAGVRDATRGRAGFAWVSLASWSAAGREAMRLRALQLRLRREQSDLIRALGEAVYNDDEERAASLKLEARERGDRIEACAYALQSALESARARVSHERAAIQPTRVLGRSNESGD